MASIQEYVTVKIREDGSRQVARNIRDVGNAGEEAANDLSGFSKVLGGIAFGATLLSLARVADQFTNLQNRLRLVTTGSANLARVTKELGIIANSTRSDFSATADMYARMANASKELGLSQQDTLDFTKSLNQAVILSGASAEEAAGGLRQLSQGLSKGVLNGDELTGVLEGLPAVADVIAKGFGVTRGQLKQMGEDGKLSATGIIDAFKKAKVELETNFGTTVPTIAQSFTVMKNNFTLFIGELDKSLGITASFAKFILMIADNLNILIPILAGVGVTMATAFSASLLVSFGAQLKILWALILANPFVALAAAVAGVVTSIYLLRDQIKLGVDDTTTLGDLMRAAWETIGPMITEVGRIAKDVFGFITEELGKSVTLWTGITFKGTSDQEDSWFGLLRSVVRTFDAIGATVRGVMVAIGRTIEFVVTEGINRFKQLGDVAYKAMTGDFAGAIESATKAGTDSAGAFGKIGDIWADAINGSFGEQMKSGLEAGLDGWVKRAKEIGAERLKGMKEGELGGGGPPVKPPVEADKDAAKKAAKELERLKDAYRGILDTADPVGAATRRLAEDEAILAKAVKLGWMEQSKMDEVMKQLAFQMRGQLDPLKALNDEIDKNIELMGMSAQQRAVESQLYQQTNALREQGKTLTIEETAALRAKLTVEQELAKISAMRDGMEEGTFAAMGRDITAMVTAMGQINNLTGGDKFNILNQILGGSLEETQAAFDARKEQFALYYAAIEQFRKQDVDNETLASEAKKALKQQEMDLYIQRTAEGLGTVAQLMGSHNKTAFKIGQAAAIAQVAITTPSAAMKAYDSLSGIPYIGPVLGAAAAAATVAMGLMQISKIRSQQPPAYRTGGSYTVGGSGGTDSQMVAFRATPGEKVNINTPSQAAAMERMARQMESGRGGGDIHLGGINIYKNGRDTNFTPEQEAREMRKQASNLLEEV